MRRQSGALGLYASLLTGVLSITSTVAEVCSNRPYAQHGGEGPFYVSGGTLRADVTEAEPGLPVQLLVKVLDPGCNPIEDAFVDIWQANADGYYSGLAGLDHDHVAHKPHARGPAADLHGGMPMIGAPSCAHTYQPFPGIPAQGPRLGARNNRPHGQHRRLAAEDVPHPDVANGTHPEPAGMGHAPLPAMRQAMGPHEGPHDHVMHPEVSSGPRPAHVLHGDAPRSANGSGYGDAHGRNLAKQDGPDDGSGILLSGASNPDAHGMAPKPMLNAYGPGQLPGQLPGAPHGMHGAHDDSPRMDAPVEGQFPGHVLGAPHGIHGPHPVPHTGAPVTARPDSFSSSPAGTRHHLAAAHGPQGMPRMEHGPRGTQTAPHHPRRGLAAQGNQLPRTSRPGPKDDAWAAAAKSSVRGPQPRKLPRRFPRLPSPAGAPHMSPHGDGLGPMGGPHSHPCVGLRGGMGPHLEPTDNSTFLRGVQPTNASGMAAFQTIFPGPVPHEPPHINVKVHLAPGAATSLQQAFERSLTVYAGQILMNRSLAEAVYSSNDAYPNASHEMQMGGHPHPSDDHSMNGPAAFPDALVSQTATFSGSVQSGLVMSITLKVRHTSEPGRHGNAMGPFPGPLPQRASDIAADMGSLDASQMGGSDLWAMPPGAGPMTEGDSADQLEGRPESVPGGPGAMGAGVGMRGSRDHSSAAGPAVAGQGQMDGLPEDLPQDPNLTDPGTHTMAPGQKDHKPPGEVAGKP
ncbi:hypothetical protein WJX74_008303 [Apatococcus lobatus]|uniref:Intradiol ring-cleavage dioxygenases domain-containing protein n=1 Tax=Apatococcus lobatus TaxID=904363 RepID=A0AAW1RR58_9CHLO